jgi:hypothetical protein
MQKVPVLRPLLWLSLLLITAALTPGRSLAQEPKLSGLSEAAFSRWLTSTEWKGESGGKRGLLWFATPGIVIWRWEVNPGVWDCRAAALINEGKGKVKWRWNPDAVASCTAAVTEDMKSIALEDGLLGKWTLQPSARKPASVAGGRLSTMGASGFAGWVEKQALRWRELKLDFARGRKVTRDKTEPGKFEIISPGVVEVYSDKERSECLLILFTPGLDGAMIYGPRGVSSARVKGAPETAVIPSPVFNDPDPPQKTLSAMKKEDFEKWFMGTEWEKDDDPRNLWYWFPTPGFASWRDPGSFFGFGGTILSPGHVTWLHRANGNDKNNMEIYSNLTTGEIVYAGGAKRFKIRLIGRRMAFQMHAPSAERMKEVMQESKVGVGNGNTITFPSTSMARWRDGAGKTVDLPLTFPGPGMAQYFWPANPADTALMSWRTPSAIRFYWIWGAGMATMEPFAPDAAGPAATPGAAIFDMGLKDTKSIPVKKPATSVNALLVMELDGGRMAGASSKLSLTSLALTNEEPATLSFNQPVGADMKKALREVARFHAIRQGGWPRGQKMELSFADKYSPKDGPSAAVACALLLESALRGITLQPDFAVTGDMNADGSVQPIGGVAAKLRGATKGGCTCIAIPDKNAVQAADLALTDGAAPFLGIQVFSILSFDDAAKLAAREDPQLRAIMDSFAAITKKVKADATALRQTDTVNALRELARQAPSHLSARFLLALAENKLPATLSPGGSVTAINLAITDALESTSRELLAKSTLDRGKVSGARSRLQQLRTKLDKSTLPLTDAWIAWSSAIDRLSAASAGGGKVEAKLVNDLKSASARIQAEESRLSADADFKEDLMR